MIKHFENSEIAENDLIKNGFRKIKNGNFVKQEITASIATIKNSEKVAVFYKIQNPR